MSRNFASDQSLVDSLRLNDTEAFEELFRRHWHNLYIYSLKKLRSSDRSRQIVRELFTELWEKRQSWPTDFSLSQHLYVEVRKAVVKHLNETLRSDTGNTIEEILPGFSVDSLQQARLPVKQQLITAEDLKRDTLNKKPNSYSPLVNMKWLIDVVSARLN